MKKALAASCIVLLSGALIPLGASASTATEPGAQNSSAYELAAARMVVKVKRAKRHRACTVRKRVVKAGGVKHVRKVKVCR